MKNAMLRQASPRVNGLPEILHDLRIRRELGVIVEVALAPHAQLQPICLEFVVLHKSRLTVSTR